MKFILLFISLSVALTSINVYAKWIPFTHNRNHIAIDIEFNGQPAKAILDSGAEINAVSLYYVEKYNNGIRKSGKIRVAGINSTEQRSLYSNIPVKIFGSNITFNKFAGLNLPGVAILFGAPFFKSFIIQIDYPNSRIQLLPRKAINMDKFSNVNLKKSRGTILPAIEVEINNKKVWLTLDTGNSGELLIKRSFAKYYNWFNDQQKTTKKIGIGANSSSKMESFILPSLKIGPYELENIPVSVPTKGQNTNIGKNSNNYGAKINKGRKTKGLLGYDILKHFIITLDYKAYKAHIVAP